MYIQHLPSIFSEVVALVTKHTLNSCQRNIASQLTKMKFYLLNITNEMDHINLAVGVLSGGENIPKKTGF